MGLFWKSRRSTKNSADNNINISTSTDIMFNIGKDLGEIKTSVDRNNKKLDRVYLIINDHTKRIERLENSRNNKRNNFFKNKKNKNF